MEGEEEKDGSVDKVIQGRCLPGCCVTVSGEGILECVGSECAKGDSGGARDGRNEKVGGPHK